jgi:hypothetical protein
MVITFSTGGDDKDPDTRCEIFIVQRDGDPAVGYLDIQGQGFGENSVRPFNVPPVGTGFTSAQLTSEQISVKITPNDDDNWDFSFSAVLYFAGGATARLDVPMTSLNQDNRQGFYPLAGAALTPAPISPTPAP